MAHYILTRATSVAKTQVLITYSCNINSSWQDTNVHQVVYNSTVNVT